MSNPLFLGWMFGLGFCSAIIVTALVIKLAAPSNPHDDSDSPGGRSGVNVVTDHKTGLQYLRAPGGGITPRLEKGGDHMREVAE